MSMSTKRLIVLTMLISTSLLIFSPFQALGYSADSKLNISRCEIKDQTLFYEGSFSDKRPITIMARNKENPLDIRYMRIITPDAEGSFRNNIKFYDEEISADLFEMEVLFQADEDVPVVSFELPYFNKTKKTESINEMIKSSKGILDFMTSDEDSIKIYNNMGVQLDLYNRSLGNESSFGKAFFGGANYIKRRDNTRPVHYEGLQNADSKYYYTELVDMVSMMYPSFEKIREDVLENEKETRPFVLCEYTHAMGNSCGDIAEYWDMIYNNEQMMGGFVWEWADHGIKTDQGFLYGGDFKEPEHDGNFCADGLLTPDRKLKSNALEMKAVYSGKTHSEVCKIDAPASTYKFSSTINIEVNEHTGEITSIKADGNEVLRTPIHFNIIRYTDNDRDLVAHWIDRCHLEACKPHIFSCEKTENTYKFTGVLAANCLMPAVEFELKYEVLANTLIATISYKIADYIESLPRFGIEFGVDKSHGNFSYVGFGPTESYVDKHVACEYGYYVSSAEENYDREYIRPQESGSHYACKYLAVKDLFKVTADLPFSCSVNPFTTEQLRTTLHSFELEENDFVNVCIDLAMRGVGSKSCGPDLPPEYEIPKTYSNTFKFVF